MPTSASKLVGSWVKVSTEPCSAPYPGEVAFTADGTYVGRASSPGAYTHWDVGTFREASPGRVDISIANDAVVSYTWSLEPDHVTFVDPQGCGVRYRALR